MKNALSIKRVFVGLWLAAFPLLVVLWYYPVITFRIRVETLLVAIFFIVGSIGMVWKFKTMRWLLIAFYVMMAVFFVFPSQLPRDRSHLRHTYGEALKAYGG